MSHSPRTSTNPAPDDGARDEVSAPGAGATHGSRDARIAVIVEAFLRQVRGGGSLDAEPFLAVSGSLRQELAPILTNLLRLESLARAPEADSLVEDPPIE